MEREINWVKERAACSLREVFQKLKLEVRDDVKKINEHYADDREYSFAQTSSGNQFSVTSSRGSSIDFSLGSNAILIANNDANLFEATLTLNNDAECRINLKGKNGQRDESELEFWQVRRRALESLFFGEVSPRLAAIWNKTA